MSLTRDFKETIKARAEQDGAFREALLTEALDAAAIAEILLGRYDRNRDGLLSLRTPAELISADGSAWTTLVPGSSSAWPA